MELFQFRDPNPVEPPARRAYAGATMGRDGRAMAENRPERLKAALRENLKRRKAQARGRDGKPAQAGAAEPEPLPTEADEAGARRD